MAECAQFMDDEKCMASKAPRMHPNSSFSFWFTSMETIKQICGDLCQAEHAKRCLDGSKERIGRDRCSGVTARNRRMSNPSSGFSLPQSLLFTAGLTFLPVMDMCLYGAQPPSTLLPGAILFSFCSLHFVPLGTLRSSGNKYWSWEVHINQTRLSQPSGLNDKIVIGVTGGSWWPLFPRLQHCKMWSWNCCNHPITMRRSLPEKSIYSKDAEQRFRKKLFHL